MQPDQFLAMAELLPEPMLLVASDGQILAANTAFVEASGYDHDALFRRRLGDIATDPPATIAAYLDACARGARMPGSLTFARAHRSLTFRCEGIACRSSSGTASSCLLLRFRPEHEGVGDSVALTDKLEYLNAQMRRSEQVEDALRRQSETLQVTLSSIGDAVIATDAQGRITFVNMVAETLTGWNLADAQGRPLADVFRIINEYSRQPVDDPVEKVLQTGGIVGLANHTLLLSRDGREVPIDDSAAPIRMPSGELFGVVLIFRDITEQKKAAHTEAWLAAIVDSSDDAIVSKTLDGIITSWNRGAARLFGYEAAEMIGKPIITIIPPELRDEERVILSRLRAGQSIDHFDTVRVAKDGRRIDISLTISPVHDAHGMIVGASKIARDISERKRAERALRDANQQKDEFLATLAHELRNPLAPIRNATEILARMELDPAVRSVSDIIGRQVGQMAHLVDDLLDVSRITAGRVRLQLEALDLRTALAMAIEACRPALRAAGHELVLHEPSEPLYIQGDRVRLPQVFSNILNNAVKYTQPRGRIEVRVKREQDEAVVRVRDNGIGIPANMLAYVFELFAQVDRSYDRTDGGLGLGLTLARRLVEMHAGRIEAHSDGPGRGSEFVVRVPTLGDAPGATADGTVAPRAVGRLRVLIADDNHDAAATLAMLVQMMGHDTEVVHDGLAAVELAEGLKPDVAILDIGMPLLDGYATMQRLAARPWSDQTVFVALTGWGQEQDRKRALAAGFDHHLIKPVDADVLQAVLIGAAPR
ncbi:MAG: PAS domain S-box protein [Pseudomonadota bacterium]|nr:PAS domain S-box protein [Pseudomonadota bacterium]